MRPLVSVMIPCFQAEGTLELALASVRAQTAGDLECLCLDDGSTDRTWTMLSEAAVRDRRFRIERSLHNRGRGAARKRLLEQARGEYLVFLDADDWMYPQRIERELAWLALDRRIAAVSAAAAVTNGPDELVGLMRPGGAKVPRLSRTSGARPHRPCSFRRP
ncbi:MAG: glycosyltransferase [Sandaracinaceae bacterium]|nr:glycosyltransferase [Sandaracinaceae bacterium]